MISPDSYRPRSAVVSVFLLIYGIVFYAFNATAADRTVLGELFSGDG